MRLALLRVWPGTALDRRDTFCDMAHAVFGIETPSGPGLETSTRYVSFQKGELPALNLAVRSEIPKTRARKCSTNTLYCLEIEQENRRCKSILEEFNASNKRESMPLIGDSQRNAGRKKKLM